MFKSKKGEIEPITGVPSLMFHILIGTVIIILLAAFLRMAGVDNRATNIEPQGNIDNTALKLRFLNDCFAYKDAISQRSYPGIVDIKKFTQENTDNCYDVDENLLKGCFKIELNNIDNKKINEVSTRNWQSCAGSLRGDSKYEEKSTPYYVLYKEKDKTEGGKLIITTFLKG